MGKNESQGHHLRRQGLGFGGQAVGGWGVGGWEGRGAGGGAEGGRTLSWKSQGHHLDMNRKGDRRGYEGRGEGVEKRGGPTAHGQK